MTPGEALLAVQAALRAHELPGGVGLVEKTRTFIVALGINGGRVAASAVIALLEGMGLKCAEPDRLGILLAALPPGARLQPAPPVRVSSADSATAAEGAALVTGKRCTGPCGQVKEPEAFPWWRKAKGYRGSRCYECDRARQRDMYHQQKTRAAGMSVPSVLWSCRDVRRPANVTKDPAGLSQSSRLVNKVTCSPVRVLSITRALYNLLPSAH